MSIVANVLVGLVAVLHLWFLVLEMFLWTKPGGRQVFGTDKEFAEASKALAANQGLYNGFLVAGLVWGLVAERDDVKLFFLGCVVVAGVFGAITVSRRILYVQAVPALVAVGAVYIARSRVLARLKEEVQLLEEGERIAGVPGQIAVHAS